MTVGTPATPLPSSDYAAASRGTWEPRSHLDVTAQQIAAIDRFNRVRRSLERAEAAGARTRELRLDAARQLDVLRRQHQALVARTHEQLRLSGDLLHAGGRTVLLAHRNAWFRDRIASMLVAGGLTIVGQSDNGADAVGVAVAEQPDLLLVEDSLGMVNGLGVLRQVLQFSPSTRVVAQVAYSERVGQMLDAGAAAVYTRRIPPADVAHGMQQLVVGTAG